MIGLRLACGFLGRDLSKRFSLTSYLNHILPLRGLHVPSENRGQGEFGMNSNLMTAGEVSKLLGNVVPATIRNWGDKGLLPMQRTQSKMRLFRRADVERVAREIEARRTARSTPALPGGIA